MSTKMLSAGGLGINWLFFMIFILLFPFSYALVGLYSLSIKDIDYSILIAPLLVTPLVFYYLGLSLQAFLISLGFILSVLLAHYMSYQDKEHYKKISIYGITANSTSKAFFVINITIIVAVYILLIFGPTDMQARLESDLSNAMDDVLPIMIGVSMLDSQKQQIYGFVEFMETSTLNSMESGMRDLSREESTMCAASIRNNMDDIDRQTKARIDKEFERQMNETLSSSLFPEPMIEQFSSIYSLFIVFSLFVTLELLRALFFVHLAGIYAWLLGNFIDVSPQEPPSNNAPVSRPQSPHANMVSRIPQSRQISSDLNPYYSADEGAQYKEKKTYTYY
ncbi:MAG: hypothetical protein ABIG84_02680 [archaeon]